MLRALSVTLPHHPSDSPRQRPTRAAARVLCRAQPEPSLYERALQSPDDRMRRWGFAELARVQPEAGGVDAMRCSVLTRFVRRANMSGQHAVLDAVEEAGLRPRLLPLFHEMMSSPYASVRLRAAPVWGALVGLHRASQGALAVTGEREPRAR